MGPGTAAVYAPEGDGATRWTAGTRMTFFKVDRHVVDDALSSALGRQVSSHIDFTPLLPPSAATDSWISMLSLWREQLFQPDSPLNQPLVGLPFVDGLVRGILFAADHRYREALMGSDQPYAPSAVRTAVDVIEAEAHLPLTLSSIAAAVTSVFARCSRVSSVIWARRRWRICARSGCVERIRPCWNPTPPW